MDVTIAANNATNTLSEPASATAPGSAPTADGILDRVVQLVPTQVIAGYTALLGITASIDQTSARWATPIALVACTVLVVMALTSAAKVQAKPQPARYVLSVLAFWAWAVTIRDPLEVFDRTIPVWIGPFGCVLIPLFGAFLMGSSLNAERR